MRDAPFIIAHRGYSSRHTENTLTAVRAAVAFGVDFVEIDVHETSDAEIVVFHDYRLNRICGASRRVRDVTLAEMKSMNPDIPSLREVLRVCRGKTKLLIEIKRADPAKVARQIEECGMEQDVIVFSLSLPRLKQFAEANPRIPRFGLIARKLKTRIAALEKSVSVEGVGLSRRLVTSRQVVEQVHKRGWKLFAWTVNRAAEMEQFANWGADGLITDYPDRAKSCLARQ